MKLAGEFEHLGYAYEGDPDYDKPLPKGVVKLIYSERSTEADGGGRARCGFFKCPWWRWGAFKEAATRMQPDLKATGIYPVATIAAAQDEAARAPSKREATGG